MLESWRPNLALIAVGVLVVWRVTYLLHAEDGPWRLIARMRELVGRGPVSGVFGCFYCLSLWVSMPVALISAADWLPRLLSWLALSGGAVLLHRTTEREGIAEFFEEEQEK